MMEILGDLPFLRVYLNDVLLSTVGDLTDHIEKLKLVLKHLEEYGFHAILEKCFFTEDKLDYLGYSIVYSLRKINGN
jgi:hypothetical protein